MLASFRSPFPSEASLLLNSYSWEVHRIVVVEIETGKLYVVDIAHLDLASCHGVDVTAQDTEVDIHDASVQEDTQMGARSKHLKVGVVVASAAAADNFRWDPEIVLAVSFVQSLQTPHTLN